VNPDTLGAMPVGMLLDYLSVRVNGPAAEGVHLRINLELTDLDERRLVELRRSVLHHHDDRQDPDADVTLRSTSAVVKGVLAGNVVLQDEVDAGRATVEGDAATLERLRGLLDDFRTWFHIVEP